MIEGNDYVRTVKKYFSFLHVEFGMNEVTEKINGNAFYQVQFHDTSKTISISYENIEEYFQVIVFKLNNGEMPKYDDKTSTLHLNTLTKVAFSKATKADIEVNNYFFSSLKADDEFRRKLLKAAKDLRLSMKMIDNL